MSSVIGHFVFSLQFSVIAIEDEQNHSLMVSRDKQEFEKIIQLLAREAASSDDGIKISPLVNTDEKGGAYLQNKPS